MTASSIGSSAASSASASGPILVTGATGFIGAHVVQHLLDRRERVRVLVRTPARLADVGLAGAPGLEVARGDLLDPPSVRAAVAGCDRVMHIAGYISTDRRERAQLHALNYDATLHLFDACAAARVSRVLYLASIFALGGGKPVAVREDVSYDLDTLRIDYFEAKRNAEVAAYRYRDRGLPLVFAYPGFCYGPGDVYDSSSRPVQQFLRRNLPAYVAGGQCALDVRDAAAGLCVALERGRVGEKYLLGGENRTYGEIFAMLAELTGLPPPRLALPRWLAERAGRWLERLHPEPPLDEQAAAIAGRYWWYDDRKARRELGYTTRPLRQTLEAAVRWQCETGRAPWPPAMARTA
jgi:dihydroflavonol-4-reductase